MSFNQNFPGLAFCLGGRSVFWGGWSPYFIDSELTDPAWPASVKKDLTQKVLPAPAPVESYLDAAARQIGTDTTNDFVFGPLHDALRQRLFDGLKARAAADPVLTGNRGALTKVEDLEAPLAQSAPSRPGRCGRHGLHKCCRRSSDASLRPKRRDRRERLAAPPPERCE